MNFNLTEEIKENQLKYRELLQHISNYKDKYVSGEYDLDELLKKNDIVFDQLRANKNLPAYMYIHDSYVLKIECEIAMQKDKAVGYAFAFNPLVFTDDLVKFLSNVPSSSDSSSPWLKLGEMAETIIHSTPSLHPIHGTFEPGSTELPTKKQRTKLKEKEAQQIAPLTTDLINKQQPNDITGQEINRIYSIFIDQKGGLVPYFEFAVDPNSYSRTVENMYYLSFMLNTGNVKLFLDENDMPMLIAADRLGGSVIMDEETEKVQSHIAMDMQEWQELVKLCQIKKAMIPPRSTRTVLRKM